MLCFVFSKFSPPTNRFLICFAILYVAATSAFCCADESQSNAVAVIGGVSLSENDLGPDLQDRLLRTRTESYNSKLSVLRDLMNARVLDLQAKSERISVQELLKREAWSRVAEPSSDEVQSAYEASDRRSTSDLSMNLRLAFTRERLRKSLIEKAESQLSERLWEKFGIQLLLHPPRLSREIRTSWNPTRGAVDSSLRIVEFSDFQCPFCGRIQPILASLQEQNVGKVSVTFKHFPISSHKDAEWQARLSECARQDGHFWEMHDFLFSHQSNFSTRDATDFARKLGMDQTQTSSCMASHEASANVAQDKQMGVDIGVTGTPTFLVNGRLVLANQSLASVVEDELKILDAARP